MTDSFEIILDGDTSDDDEETPNHGYNLRRTVRSESGDGAGDGGSSSQTTSTPATSTRISQLNNHYLARLIRMFARNRDEDDDDENAAGGAEEEVLYNFSSESSDDDDAMSKFWPIRRLPKKPPKPCPSAVEALQKTDFYYETSQELGPNLEDCHRFKVQHNLLSLLQNRETGDVLNHRFGNFSNGAKRQLLENVLPNSPSEVAKYHQKVFCGTYSRKGDLFMSACQDQKIRLYDTTGNAFKYKRSIRARNVGWSVLDVALSPDGYNIIYSSWCDSIHQVSLFEEDDSKHIALPLDVEEHGRFCIFSLRFSADGFEILGGANDGYIYLYDRIKQGTCLKIEAHEDDVNAVAFVDSATHILASGGDDGLVKIWDRRSLREDRPKPVGTFAGHTDGITYIDTKDDSRHIITNSKDQSIKLWDLRKFASKRSIEQTRKAVRNQNWDYRWARFPGGRRITIEDDPSLMTFKGHHVSQTLIRCRFSPAHSTGQRYIYTGCASGAVFIYDVLTGEIVKTLNNQNGCVRDISWHPFLSEIVSSSWDCTVMRWKYEEISDKCESDLLSGEGVEKKKSQKSSLLSK